MLETERTKVGTDKVENDIVYSRAIKAGKRIYYLDVKKSRNDDLYVAITESKKKVFGTDSTNLQVTYEKHKIFLYKEDFDKFLDGIEDVIRFVKAEQKMEDGDGLDAQNFVFESPKQDETEDEIEEKTPKKGFFSKFKL